MAHRLNTATQSCFHTHMYHGDCEGRLNTFIAQMRSLLQDEPTQSTWFCFCDLMERLACLGALPIALDYIQHGEHPTVRQMRNSFDAPWHWHQHKTFKQLATKRLEPPAPSWIPLATFTIPEARDAFLKSRLPIFERHSLQGIRPRSGRRRYLPKIIKFEPTQGAQWLLDWSKRGRHWCIEHDLPTDGLTIRIDAAKFGTTTPPRRIVSLQLLAGCAVQLCIADALRVKGGSHYTCLTEAHVMVPTGSALLDDSTIAPYLSTTTNGVQFDMITSTQG